MKQQIFYEWLEATFASFPKANEESYKAIWREGVLRFNKKGKEADLIDELSARLVCMALSERQQILIVLPDHLPHRGAFLFASALLLESVDRVRSHTRGGQVLYFGSTIGIREHLRQVYVNNLCLAEVFPQKWLQRNLNVKKITSGGSKGNKINDSVPISLPNVLCIYSPYDPVAICQQNKASWFAVDCANDTKAHWLRPLVEEAKRRNIPLVAWVQNPLSSAVADFRSAGGQVFTWPATDIQTVLPVGTPIDYGLYRIFSEVRSRSIQPLVIESPYAKISTEHLWHANMMLSKAANIADATNESRLVWEAIRISWKYLRTLESLCIPLNLFETEVRNFWGTSSLLSIREAANKYLDALAVCRSSIYTLLIEVQSYLQEVHSQFEQQGPPLWVTLSGLCVGDVVNGAAKLFVFPTNSSKKLFSLGMLAYYNITEDDLKQLHIGLISLRELYDFLTEPLKEDITNIQTMRLLAGLPPTDLRWEYCLVGMPSSASTLYLDPMLRQDGFQIVVYPYQIGLLTRRIEQWERAVYPSLINCVDTIAVLTKRSHPSSELFNIMPRLAMKDIQSHTTETPANLSKTQSEKIDIWQPYDPLEEFAILMHADLEDNTSAIFSRSNSQIDNVVGSGIAEFVEEAWFIEFISGEHVLLNTNEKVNVITSTSRGSKTDERFVSSLRVGDRIVFVHGQRKQSLLDLVLSRIYRNPAVSLHVKLVERWQEDFAAAYQHRILKESKWNFDMLFEEMRARGSRISDPQPLRNWLHGETLRPHDQEDLRRLAEILELEFVHQHYKRIHQAGSRLAGLHASLSRRLNVWLSHEAPDIVVNAVDEDDMIDEQLGLTFQDFRNSLSILQVKSTRKEKGLFERDRLGHLERENSN